MISAGFDIGSRTLKLVIMQDNQVIRQTVQPNTYNFQKQVADMLAHEKWDYLVGTGYGRHFFDSWNNTSTVSEIKAFAKGVCFSCGTNLTVLDIGGQDTKAIALDHKGRMQKFVMNDKCAAGTGRFLEIMANALNLPLDQFGSVALTAQKAEKINSMCTVFAESEVISTLSRGALPNEVALGIHDSIVDRALNLLNKVGLKDKVVFVGGVARNKAVAQLLRKKLPVQVVVPPQAQLTGALGAALLAAEATQ